MSEAFYPDILGQLAEERLTVDDVLHCAFGVFPGATTIGQPFEGLLLLQSLIDQPLGLQLSFRTPPVDPAGNLLNVFTPKPRLALTLPGGECGLLHIPLTPELPTQAGSDIPLLSRVQVQKPERFRAVRPLSGGPPPSILAISPFRITVLRDVGFLARVENGGHLCATFDVLPGHVPFQGSIPAPRYETLWATADLARQQEQARAMAPEALRYAKLMNRRILYEILLSHTQEVFGEAGLPLHPGEAIFITKLLTYAMADGLDLESGFALIESRWFERLCWLMAYNPPIVEDQERLIKALYPDALHDAVRLGLHMVAVTTRADLGDMDEQARYASNIVAAIQGHAPLSLEHVYLPLVMAGIIVIVQITAQGENPWHSLDQLQEARSGRISLAGATLRDIFDLLDHLIARSERLLNDMRIMRDN
ncbi:MAG: hypothetical protein GXY36_15200 [Chloroflexi bacterium]|jgi:hypothetical protein|nr:hypothetical protein [Chloroflexota bacterium]